MAPNLVVHCQRDPYDVYVGRAMPRYRLTRSKWCNPNREWGADEFEAYLQQRGDLMAQLEELRGQVLGCWCAPKGGYPVVRPFTCHAQVLAWHANRPPVRRGVIKALVASFLTMRRLWILTRTSASSASSRTLFKPSSTRPTRTATTPSPS